MTLNNTRLQHTKEATSKAMNFLWKELHPLLIEKGISLAFETLDIEETGSWDNSGLAQHGIPQGKIGFSASLGEEIKISLVTRGIGNHWVSIEMKKRSYSEYFVREIELRKISTRLKTILRW